MSGRLTQSEVIQRAKNLHNNKYDYSLVEYKTIKDKVKIICPEHGIFEQTLQKHLMGRGCKLCGYKLRSKNNTKQEDEFILELKRIHGDKYDYSLVKYVNRKTKIKLICPKHGIFEMLPLNLLAGSGCFKCAHEKVGQDKLLSFDEYLKKVKMIHGDKYDYSLTTYAGLTKKIKIICPEHGIFEQNAGNHLYSKQGCPKCASIYSNKENRLIEIIKAFKVLPEIKDRKIIKPLELDIYIPDKKIAFEFNGLYWHSEQNAKDRNYHLNKTNLCKEKGIQLIHIFEDEFDNKLQIVKARIKHLLGESQYKIYARNTEVLMVDSLLAKKFIEKYHIQGAINSSVNLGLFYKKRLVALMTFGKSRFNKNYDWELLRFCTISNFNITGGASKLLCYFRKNYNGSIISYADKRWSNGNLYRQLGFKELEDSKPNYFYFKNGSINRLSRVQFQKHKLKDKLEFFDEKLTEYENMLKNGYNRIWDCGNKVFVLKND